MFPSWHHRGRWPLILSIYVGGCKQSVKHATWWANGTNDEFPRTLMYPCVSVHGQRWLYSALSPHRVAAGQNSPGGPAGWRHHHQDRERLEAAQHAPALPGAVWGLSNCFLFWGSLFSRNWADGGVAPGMKAASCHLAKTHTFHFLQPTGKQNQSMKNSISLFLEKCTWICCNCKSSRCFFRLVQ